MPIAVECGDCRKRYAVDERAVGRKVKCRHCGNVFTAEPAARREPAAQPAARAAAPATAATRPAVSARPAPAWAAPRPLAPPPPTPAADEPADFDAIMALASQASDDPGVPLPPPPPLAVAQPSSSRPPAPLSGRQGQASLELASIVTWVVILLGICLSLQVLFYWQSAFVTGFFFAVLDGLLLLAVGGISALVAAIRRGFGWGHLRRPVLLSGCGAVVLCTSLLFMNAAGMTDQLNSPRNAGSGMRSR